VTGDAGLSAVDPLAAFGAPVRSWFEASFDGPTRAQQLGWPAIARGESVLVLAPTGSGKTLAAFLAAIDRLLTEPVPEKGRRCRVLYLSPLKALAVDVERNLRAPLVGAMRTAERLGLPVHEPRVAIRTGDTSHRDRAEFLRDPADILITTPESLYLMLTSRAREALRSVDTVIVDEVHAIVATKRGAHLALSLERLAALTGRPLQRIGLSATQRPLDEVARFLGGLADGHERPVRILDAGHRKAMDLRVEVAVEDLARLGAVVEIPSGPAAQGTVRTSIWPAMHPLILELIRSHRSTLIFVNSRRLAERLANALNELAGETIVHAHHGSIAREQRLLIEDQLKSGRMPALVATSSLELGIDMGAIDLVIQVETPPSVASGIQRIGRAGHTIDTPSTGVILPKYRGDLLACAALTERMLAGAVEELRYPRNPLDVLAQQIVAMVAIEDLAFDELERIVRRAAPFAELPRSALEAVLDMLSGRYPSDDFAELRPRIVWDRTLGMLRAREGSKRIAITNGGTIPDRGLYGVFILGAPKGQGRVGELDEEMVFETHPGDVFLLGASSWRAEEITHDRVLVSPAPGQPGKMPFWHGENAARPLEFGRAIGALTRTLRTESPADAERRLIDLHKLDGGAARNLLAYLRDQEEATGVVPDDRTIVVERFIDELGDWRVCLLSPFGGKVHAPLAMAIAALVARWSDAATDIVWTDDGIVLRFPEATEPPSVDQLFPDADLAQDLVMGQLATGGAHSASLGAPVNALFASHFREAAQRALLLPRRFPGQRAPLWIQRKRAAELLNTTAKYGSFPIVLETYREVLQDIFDMPALLDVLRRIRDRRIRVVTVDTRQPSPFAAALLFNYVANFIYDGDAPLAERRAQALLVDPVQLRELLGEVELRELLDPDALGALELQLQVLTPERAVRHPDGLHELLLRLGDLSLGELRARSAGDPQPWLIGLERDRRVLRVIIGGEGRYIAAEDASRYRDTVGIPLPPGVPDAFLERVADPVVDLVQRYARTHGPFRTAEVAARLGIGEATARPALAELAASGRIVEGAFRPGGTGGEWCDSGVLRTLRQRSLAKLRHEVEPVDPAAFARFTLAWHGLDAPRRDRSALLEAGERIEGARVPASVLEPQILRGRIADYDPRDLDALLASGQLIWVGAGSLGQRDGRVALYRAEHGALLPDAPADPPSGALHLALLEHLRTRGASFFPQLLVAAGQPFVPDLLDALWDLVWAGLVTNDTFAPLRAFLRPGRFVSASGRGILRRATVVADVPPTAVGRWSLVSALAAGDAPSSTARASARVTGLLERHGVLTREAVQAEEAPGGFTAVYGVLKAMEEAGRARRGYFVAGRGATQFALPVAVERLRAYRERPESPTAVLLAATDPANVYGSGLPWPERSEVARRPMRAAGASVVLVDGVLAAWIAKGERDVLSFPTVPEGEVDPAPALVAERIAGLAGTGRRKVLYVETVDGVPARESRLGLALRACGFVDTAQGMLRRPGA